MTDMADVIATHQQKVGVRDMRSHCWCGWAGEMTGRAFIEHQAAALSAAGFGPVQEARASLERLEALAAIWEARGEHDMKFSKTVPDEDIAMVLLAEGAAMVENARHIRNAIAGSS